MQSDYSGQGVNWILTGRSDMCCLVKRSLSKWWTEIRLAAWSSCNLLHVIWWGVGFNGLPITCDIREREREFLTKCYTVHLFNCGNVDMSFQKSKFKSPWKIFIRSHKHTQVLLRLLWLKIKSTCSAGWGSFIFERSSFSSLSLPSSKGFKTHYSFLESTERLSTEASISSSHLYRYFPVLMEMNSWLSTRR